MQNTLKINVSALCDKAGRHANQDSIYLSCENVLSKTNALDHEELHGKQIPLPVEGSLFVVADGMGGMNVGEVASRLVVETMSSELAALAGRPVGDAEAVMAAARRAVFDADNAIKTHVKENPSAAGTGSTVVLLWLLGDKAVVAWCGDSRCYRYNPRRGLEQLSHDHSYVQELVDKGKLPPEMAFGHDQSNIITRCLSDDPQVAEPDVVVVDVYRDDMFLLCSDGLCGLLPDEETQRLIEEAGGDVKQALANCWQCGSEAQWSDNVSIILVSVDGIDAVAPERVVEPLPKRQVLSYSDTVAEDSAGRKEETPEKEILVEVDESQNDTEEDGKKRRRFRLLLVIAAVVAFLGIVFFVYQRSGKAEKDTPREKNSNVRHERGKREPSRMHFHPGQTTDNAEKPASEAPAPNAANADGGQVDYHPFFQML